MKLWIRWAFVIAFVLGLVASLVRGDDPRPTAYCDGPDRVWYGPHGALSVVALDTSCPLPPPTDDLPDPSDVGHE